MVFFAFLEDEESHSTLSLEKMALLINTEISHSTYLSMHALANQGIIVATIVQSTPDKGALAS